VSDIIHVNSASMLSSIIESCKDKGVRSITVSLPVGEYQNVYDIELFGWKVAKITASGTQYKEITLVFK